MNSGGEPDIESLLDRLQEIHHQVMGDVEPAEREHILVVRPLAFHHLDFETLLLEESFLDRAEDRRLAGQSDIADADLVGCAAGGGVFPAAGQEQNRARHDEDGSSQVHFESEAREIPQ